VLLRVVVAGVISLLLAAHRFRSLYDKKTLFSQRVIGVLRQIF
jgi:hypothetical protein